MSIIKYLIALVILVALLAVAYMFRSSYSAIPAGPIGDDQTTICTMDAMMCPDGTYVGRTGPSCQFVCPSVTATTSTTLYEEFTVGLNQSKTIGHTTVKAWAVTQDSRCPSDVMCIQAGKVVVALNISSPAGDSSKEVTIGETIEVNSLVFTLQDVRPYPVSTKKIQDGEYKFIFTVKGK